MEENKPAEGQEVAPPAEPKKEETAPSQTTPEVTPAPAAKTPKKTFTRRERLEFEKSKIEKELSELNAADVFQGDDDKPVTVGMLKDIKKQEATGTAIEMAEGIEDATEREQVKHYITNRIVPSGNAEQDFKDARAAVNNAKNTQIVDELNRKGAPASTPAAPGAPAKSEPAFTPTEEELVFMGPPYNLGKEAIIATRNKLAKSE